MTTRWLSIASFALATLAASTAGAFEPTFNAGFGLPELAQLRIGAFVHPRVSVEAYGGAVLFNPLIGVGATGYFLGEARTDGPPLHALLVQGTFALNPRQRPISLQGGGETIGGGGLLYTGYALSLEGGFLFHAKAGVLLYEDSGFAAGPLVSIAGGWKF